MTSLIVPKEIPSEVRLEAGMVLARIERATDKRPERRKVIVLVRPQTVRRPISVFNPQSEYHDVTQWICVRLAGSSVPPDVHPMMGPGSLSAQRERTIRRMFRFVGFVGEIRGAIDWDRL